VINGNVVGDPHFVGLDGVKYSFQGEVGKVFAMVSDPVVQVNSLFIKSQHEGTWLGPSTIRFCDHVVLLAPNGTVSLDDRMIQRGTRVDIGSMIIDWLPPVNNQVLGVTVTLPHRWTFTVQMNGYRIDFSNVMPHTDQDDLTHGVLGHTLEGKKVKHCNTGEQGACEVEGDYTEYIVADGLYGTEWAHSFFSKQTCGM